MIVEEIQIGEFSSVFASLLHATHNMVVQYKCMTLNYKNSVSMHFSVVKFVSMYFSVLKFN